MTKADQNTHIPTKREHWGSIIVPGRRALGETWTRLDITHDKDQVYVTNEGEAPFVPENGKIQVVAAQDAEYTNYVLESLPDKIRERQKNPQGMSTEEQAKLLNEMWQEFWAKKMKEVNASSQFGAGGATLRQR